MVCVNISYRENMWLLIVVVTTVTLNHGMSSGRSKLYFYNSSCSLH